MIGKKPLSIIVDNADAQYSLDMIDKADVEISITEETMQDIVAGRMTFQRAFMAGNMKMKGDFKLFRTLDELFVFMN